MNCDVLTLFPAIVEAAVSDSILKRASEKGLVKVTVTDLRSFATDKHKTADDYPFGGGAGMVMKPDLVFDAVDAVREDAKAEGTRIILLSPQGRLFSHEMALELSKETRRIVFICGRYEGVDERVRLSLADEEVSIGDYVLSGGELAAAVIIEASARLIPGVLGADESSEQDSFYDGMLDYPHYTRPAEYRGMAVPETLLSGNHEKIRLWRRKEALRATLNKRPDLFDKIELSKEDRRLLEEIKTEDN